MNIIIEKALLLAPLTKLVKHHRAPLHHAYSFQHPYYFFPENIDVYSTDLELSAISHVAHGRGSTERKIVVHGRKFLEILKEWTRRP